MVMAVVVINGRPSVFTDTDDYFVEGRTFVLGIAYATGIAKPPTAADRPRRHRRRPAVGGRPAHVAHRDRRALALLRRVPLRDPEDRHALADRCCAGSDRRLAGLAALARRLPARAAMDRLCRPGGRRVRLDPALLRRLRHAGRLRRLRRRRNDAGHGVLGSAAPGRARRAGCAARLLDGRARPRIC